MCQYFKPQFPPHQFLGALHLHHHHHRPHHQWECIHYHNQQGLEINRNTLLTKKFERCKLQHATNATIAITTGYRLNQVNFSHPM